MKLRLLTAAVWAMGAGAAFAEDMDVRTVVPSFTPENVLAATKQAGYSGEIYTNNDGTRGVAVVGPTGIKYIAKPVMCNEGGRVGCAALSVSAWFQGWPFTLDSLNKFNQHRAFTKTYQDGDKAYLTRYEIADFGIPYGNILSNIVNFNRRAEEFKQMLASGSVISSTAPDAKTKVTTLSMPATPAGLAAAHEMPSAADVPAAYINKP